MKIELSRGVDNGLDISPETDFEKQLLEDMFPSRKKGDEYTAFLGSPGISEKDPIFLRIGSIKKSEQF